MKVALSHDWLNGMRGGEKCLEVLCELYPESPIFTLFYEKGKASKTIVRHSILTSWLENFPFVFSHYRYYLPLFPAAMEALDLGGTELLISTSHCVAKGTRKPAGALHLCYCFTPMRYAWELFEEYFGHKSGPEKALIRFFIERLKAWDLKANENVDHFVAISNHVKERIRHFYQRDSEVIYPPVDTEFYSPDEKSETNDFYLVVSALVPYKRIDLAVRAFNRLDRRLVVIGEGPEKERLQRMATPNIQFLGWQSDETLKNYYRRAKALIFPGEEDFGIVPLEVQACGRFVIAYGKGGALETVVDGKTGIFFREPDEENLREAVRRFEKISLSPGEARKNAQRFGRERFKKEMKNMINRELARREKVVG